MTNRLDKEHNIYIKHAELDRLDGVSSSDLNLVKKFYTCYSENKSLKTFYTEANTSVFKQLFFDLLKNELGIKIYNRVREGLIYIPSPHKALVDKEVRIGIFISMLEKMCSSVQESIVLFNELLINIDRILFMLVKFATEERKFIVGCVGSAKEFNSKKLLEDYYSEDSTIVIRRVVKDSVLTKKLNFLYGEK